MRPRHRHILVVVVQPLRRLPRPNVDAVQRVQQVPLVEEVVVEREHRRVQRELVEAARLVEQRVDALRAQALERVPPRLPGRPRLRRPRQPRQLRLGLGHLAGGEGVRDDDVPVSGDLVDELLDITGFERLCHYFSLLFLFRYSSHHSVLHLHCCVQTTPYLSTWGLRQVVG